MKVNLFIVGAPKAGTTSLHYYLNQHPSCCMSSIKEPNYFSQTETKKLFYNIKPIESINEYNKLFAKQTKIIGEASVSYLYHEAVPGRIFNYNPKAKIIIILRNPVDRAFSHFSMDYRLGYCKKSLREIIENPRDNQQEYQQYILLGKYSVQIKRYIDTFSEDNVKVMLYDDIQKDLMVFLHKVFSFLDIPNKEIDLDIRNDSFMPKNYFIGYLYKSHKLRKVAKLLTNDKRAKKIKSLLAGENTKNNTDDLRNTLQQYYKTDLIDLGEILNHNLSQWKSS